MRAIGLWSGSGFRGRAECRSIEVKLSPHIMIRRYLKEAGSKVECKVSGSGVNMPLASSVFFLSGSRVFRVLRSHGSEVFF